MSAEYEAIPPTKIKGHELIEVGNRRWCICCDLFQRKSSASPWRDPPAACPRNTPYAVQADREAAP